MLVTFEYFTMKCRFDFHPILLHQLSGCLIIALALDALHFGKQLCEKLAKLWVIGDTYVSFSVALLKTDCIAFLITPPGYECPVAHVSLFYLLSGLDTDRADTDLLISQLRPQGAEGNIWLQLQEDGTSVILPGPPRVELPIRFAHIYKDKAWQRLEGWMYAADRWKQFCSRFDGRLYEAGSTFDDFTGGWTFAEYKKTYLSGSAAWKSGSLLEDRMELHSTTNDPVILGTKQRIAVSGFSTLNIDWQLLENYNTGSTNIRVSLSTGYDAVQESVMQMSIGKDFERKISTMNISNLSGEYYVSLRIVPAAAGIRGQIFSIYLT